MLLMYVTFIKGWLFEGIPKPFVLESLYIPEEPIEYLKWSICKLDTDTVEELTYLDYSSNAFVAVKDFEELFYYIDIAIRFCQTRSDTMDVIYPWDHKNITFIELRHACKRAYKSFNEIIVIFKAKVLAFLETINQCADVDSYYVIKRWRGLINDLNSVIDALQMRSKQ